MHHWHLRFRRANLGELFRRLGKCRSLQRLGRFDLMCQASFARRLSSIPIDLGWPFSTLAFHLMQVDALAMNNA
jgi:hypothetical protein